MSEKNQALKYILIGVAITVGLGVCGVGSCVALVGGGAFWAYRELDAPAQEAQRFLADLGSGKFDAARERTSKAFRARHTPEAFTALMKTQPALVEHRSMTLPSRGLINERAQLGGVITTATGTTGVELELVEEGKAWRVDLLRVAGMPVE